MTPAPSHPQRCPIRLEVLAFAMRMEMALRKHDKERGNSYKECDSEFLIRRLKEEVSELEEAIEKFDDTPWLQKSYLLADPVVAVLSEGADVGNFAMMASHIAHPSEKHMMDYIAAWDLPCASHTTTQSDPIAKECIGRFDECASDGGCECVAYCIMAANNFRTTTEAHR